MATYWENSCSFGLRNVSESAKYSEHLINRVLHGAPIIEVILLREEKPVLALSMLSDKQTSHWYHFNVFGMTRTGLEPAPPASEANALTITLSGHVFMV